jgi:hypothetical protein
VLPAWSAKVPSTALGLLVCFLGAPPPLQVLLLGSVTPCRTAGGPQPQSSPWSMPWHPHQVQPEQPVVLQLLLLPSPPPAAIRMGLALLVPAAVLAGATVPGAAHWTGMVAEG